MINITKYSIYMIKKKKKNTNYFSFQMRMICLTKHTNITLQPQNSGYFSCIYLVMYVNSPHYIFINHLTLVFFILFHKSTLK